MKISRVTAMIISWFSKQTLHFGLDFYYTHPRRALKITTQCDRERYKIVCVTKTIIHISSSSGKLRES